jgi:hypothetical protein
LLCFVSTSIFRCCSVHRLPWQEVVDCLVRFRAPLQLLAHFIYKVVLRLWLGSFDSDSGFVLTLLFWLGLFFLWLYLHLSQNQYLQIFTDSITCAIAASISILPQSVLTVAVCQSIGLDWYLAFLNLGL